MAEEVSNTSYTSLFDKILDTGLGIADSYFTSRSERAAAQNQKTLLEAQIQANAENATNMMKIGIGLVGAVALVGAAVLIFRR
jgi:hypothetical protein